MRRPLECATHGTEEWQETVVCEGCGNVYRFTAIGSSSRRADPLADADLRTPAGEIVDKKCPVCGAAFPDALHAICSHCYEARAARAGVN